MTTLSLILVIPAVAALLAMRAPVRTLRFVALAGAGASLLFSMVAFNAAGDGSPLSLTQDWVPAVGLSLRLSADGVSSSLLLLNGLLFVVAFVCTRLDSIDRPRLFFAMMLLTQTAVAGVLLARDMIVFYVFWESLLVPLFILITAFGEARARYAAIKFLIYTGLGSLAMLLAILTLYAAEAGPGVAPSFAFDQLAAAHLRPGPLFFSLSAADLVFAGFALAFVVKAPIFPFHGWLADAYTTSPTPVVMVLAGVVSKLGPYGLYRVAIGILPAEAQRFSPLLMALSAAGVVYGALLALRQRDAKRMVAYLSLSHMCFISLGIVGLTAAGLSGGVLQMVNHGILIASLFFIVGHLETRLGTRDRSQVGGLSRRAPGLAALFLVLCLAILGLPGLNGFAGEYLIMLGTFTRSRAVLGLAALGVILASWYTLRLYQGLMNGPETEGENVDIDSGGAGVLGGMAALAVLIGIYPAPLVGVISRSVAAVTGLLGVNPG